MPAVRLEMPGINFCFESVKFICLIVVCLYDKVNENVCLFFFVPHPLYAHLSQFASHNFSTVPCDVIFYLNPVVSHHGNISLLKSVSAQQSLRIYMAYLY